MSDEKNALGEAKIGGGLYLKEFPAKIRVLTRDPMVYVDSTYAATHYVFAVYNLDEEKVQILDKGSSFASRFQEIDSDPDFGGDVRKIDIKITTNGKDGSKEVRYTLTPMGNPGSPSKTQLAIIIEQGFNLAEKVKKNNPNALRLSEVNSGMKLEEPEESLPSSDKKDVVIEDIGDEPINLDDIPF